MKRKMESQICATERDALGGGGEYCWNLNFSGSYIYLSSPPPLQIEGRSQLSKLNNI